MLYLCLEVVNVRNQNRWKPGKKLPVNDPNRRKLSRGEKADLIGSLFFNTRSGAKDPKFDVWLEPWEEKLMRWTSRFWRLLKIFAVALSLMGAVVFGLFIMEEAIQRAGWACYRWADLGEVEPLEACAARIEAWAQKLDDLNYFIGWISPFTYDAYAMFAESAQVEARSYQALARRIREGCYKDWKTRKWVCPQVVKGE